MPSFSPPANVDDFEVGNNPDALAEGWSKLVEELLGRAREAPQNDGHSFFDPVEAPDGGTVQRAVVWDAFPGSLTTWFGADRADADVASESLATMQVGFAEGNDDPVEVEFRQQDEYCEWHTELESGFVRRVTFTSESPEYWTHLAETDLDLVARLYSELLGADVPVEDLVWPHDVMVPSADMRWTTRYAKDTYNPWNPWNTRKGIVHTTHPDNTVLKAALLIAGASVLRHDEHGQPITDADPLIAASGFGDPNRTSDPAIGGFINAEVEAGREVGLADPAGLYISDLPVGGFTGPGGEDVSGAWTIVRGDPRRAMGLRAVFEVPEGLDHVLLDGVPVTTGAQIARRVRMVANVATRPRTSARPDRLAPIATAVPRPDHPAHRAVFFSDMDWPAPPVVEPPASSGGDSALSPTTSGPLRPKRLDSRALNALAVGAERDGRWSRWSLLGRWS